MAEGKGGAWQGEEALLKGEQVWVPALVVKAGGPCPRRGAAGLQWLGQVDGAESEAIPLKEARGGGPSALSHLQLGLILAVLVNQVRHGRGNFSIGQSLAPICHFHRGLRLGRGKGVLGLPRRQLGPILQAA